MEKKNLLLGLPGTVVARQLKRFIRISRSFEALSTTFGIIFWNMRVIFFKPQQNSQYMGSR